MRDKGFQLDRSDLKVQATLKRLQPAVRRQDLDAVRAGLRQCRERYGNEVATTALNLLMKDSDWMLGVTWAILPKNSKQMLGDEAIAILAKVVEDAGGRLGFDFKASDEGFVVSSKAVEAIRETGYPNWREFPTSTVEQISQMGLRRPFFHPLTETDEHDLGNGAEPTINSWGFVSLTINAAMGWLDDQTPSEQAIKMIKEMVPAVAPNADVDQLMWRARYDDRMLLKLTAYVNDSFNQKTLQSMEDPNC